MRKFETFEDVLSLIGQEVAWSDWILITQARIDQFAQASADHQWIHTDPAKAANGPFKSTIAHGFLSLSLIPHLFEGCVTMPVCSMAINYGLNKVRFTDVVEVNSAIRAKFLLAGAELWPDPRGLQTVWDVEINKEGSPKPVCVAQCVWRHYA
jgi:acyl dehydratase